MRNAQCTCPHHYTAVGLQRFGTDACCPAHGAPKAPEPVVSRPALSPAAWCTACGNEHARGIECPEHD